MFSFREKKLNLDEKWFNSLKKDLEESYLKKYTEPWKQAGFLSTEEAWMAARKPIADCLQKSGTFLDIGCANGFLIESILNWTSHDITPYGIDLSAKLIEAAKTRLPKYSNNLFVGSAPYWTNPVKFDYARTDLGYAMEEFQEQYLHKLFTNYLVEGGHLLVTEYRVKKHPFKEPWLNEKIQKWDFTIVDQKSGFFEGKELARVLVLSRQLK
jgi:SAM-dependent methyltransferase